jgi:hypothetical protein
VKGLAAWLGVGAALVVAIRVTVFQGLRSATAVTPDSSRDFNYLGGDAALITAPPGRLTLAIVSTLLAWH